MKENLVNKSSKTDKSCELGLIMTDEPRRCRSNCNKQANFPPVIPDRVLTQVGLRVLPDEAAGREEKGKRKASRLNHTSPLL